MRARCSRPDGVAWKYYGGRGIQVCERWENYDNFVEDMGFCPEGLTLDRIDGNGHYEPGNCRWVDRKAQARNRKNNNFLTYEGRTQTITDWADEIGISPSGISYRLRTGSSVEEALSPELRRSYEAPHGTVSRYTNRRCRCHACTVAMNTYTRENRRAKRLKKAI